MAHSEGPVERRIVSKVTGLPNEVLELSGTVEEYGSLEIAVGD
jgi:hypothetical protein